MELPISARIAKPYIDQTFWVNVIGRGYIPPTRNFRWRADRMKIQPTNRLMTQIVKRRGGAVLLVGTRRAESQNRSRNMKRLGVEADGMNPHSSIDGCRVFAPLADLSDNYVWTVLMQRKPPWSGSHRELITLYRNAGGECPLVLSKEDEPSCGTSSPRFGCWTCTVVKKDRSMRGTTRRAVGSPAWAGIVPCLRSTRGYATRLPRVGRDSPYIKYSPSYQLAGAQRVRRKHGGCSLA